MPVQVTFHKTLEYPVVLTEYVFYLLRRQISWSFIDQISVPFVKRIQANKAINKDEDEIKTSFRGPVCRS